MRIHDETYQEIRKQFHNDNQKKSNEILLIILGIILLPVIFSWLFIRKSYEYVPDISNLPEPIQTTTSGGTTIIGRYGETVHIEFLAEYDMQGRILAKHDYNETFSKNKTTSYMSPRDFAIGWGVLGNKEHMDKFIWNELVDRVLYAYLKLEYYDWFTETFGGEWRTKPKSFITSYSNNHLIRSNQKIRLLLRKLKVGDVVRIKGYLINAYSDDKVLWHWGPSSLVRDDWGYDANGNGSCEIIYVTDITRLKQKK